MHESYQHAYAESISAITGTYMLCTPREGSTPLVRARSEPSSCVAGSAKCRQPRTRCSVGRVPFVHRCACLSRRACLQGRALLTMLTTTAPRTFPRSLPPGKEKVYPSSAFDLLCCFVAEIILLGTLEDSEQPTGAAVNFWGIYITPIIIWLLSRAKSIIVQ